MTTPIPQPDRRTVLSGGAAGLAALGVTGLALPAAAASASVLGPQALAGEVDVTFTTAGASGRTGPTQAQVDTAYAASQLAGAVTAVDGIQRWTVPLGGTYRITAAGAEGGASNDTLIGPGGGAVVAGTFELDAGTELLILVGQAGGAQQAPAPPPAGGGGGGGGTFVVRATSDPVGLTDVLVIAGGGGGAGGGGSPARRAAGDGVGGQVPDARGCGSPDTFGEGAGGCDGAAGPMGSGDERFAGGGGGGLLGSAVNTLPETEGRGGGSFVTGGLGGAAGVEWPAVGGFGGGGGSNFPGGGGGGAGGGAGGTGFEPYPGGGGGGSLNAGDDPVAAAGERRGHGEVRIVSL